MYLVMMNQKPTSFDSLEIRRELNVYATSYSYEGESIHTIKQNLLKEPEDTVVVSADSRLLKYVFVIVPINNVYLYDGKSLQKFVDLTPRILRPGHNMMRLFETGEFNSTPIKKNEIKTDSRMDKILINHQSKSNQVKKLERKLKNKAKHTISLQALQELLDAEKNNPINGMEYRWDDDDSLYIRDTTRQEARIELLQKLIEDQKNKVNQAEICWRK